MIIKILKFKNIWKRGKILALLSYIFNVIIAKFKKIKKEFEYKIYKFLKIKNYIKI
jgi:hypothetical protein